MDDVSLISVITHSPHFAYYLACQSNETARGMKRRILRVAIRGIARTCPLHPIFKVSPRVGITFVVCELRFVDYRSRRFRCCNAAAALSIVFVHGFFHMLVPWISGKMRTTTLISLIYSVMGTVAYLMTIFAVVRLGKKTFSTAFISIYVIAAIVVGINLILFFILNGSQ